MSAVLAVIAADPEVSPPESAKRSTSIPADLARVDVAVRRGERRRRRPRIGEDHAPTADQPDRLGPDVADHVLALVGHDQDVGGDATVAGGRDRDARRRRGEVLVAARGDHLVAVGARQRREVHGERLPGGRRGPRARLDQGELVRGLDVEDGLQDDRGTGRRGRVDRGDAAAGEDVASDRVGHAGVGDRGDGAVGAGERDRDVGEPRASGIAHDVDADVPGRSRRCARGQGDQRREDDGPAHALRVARRPVATMRKDAGAMRQPRGLAIAAQSSSSGAAIGASRSNDAARSWSAAWVTTTRRTSPGRTSAGASAR